MSKKKKQCRCNQSLPNFRDCTEKWTIASHPDRYHRFYSYNNKLPKLFEFKIFHNMVNFHHGYPMTSSQLPGTSQTKTIPDFRRLSTSCHRSLTTTVHPVDAMQEDRRTFRNKLQARSHTHTHKAHIRVHYHHI